MKIIVSPHPDDEVIACMSQMPNARVIQIFAFEYRLIEFLELSAEFPDMKYNALDDLDELVKLCENADEVFIPSPCDLNIEHKWISNYILKKSNFSDNTKVFMYSYNYLFPIAEKPLETVKFPVNLELKKSYVQKYYKSQYNDLNSCGLLDGLKEYEEFAIWKK